MAEICIGMLKRRLLVANEEPTWDTKASQKPSQKLRET